MNAPLPHGANAPVEQALSVLRDYVERSTHWKEGGADRHAAKLALKALDASLPSLGAVHKTHSPSIATNDPTVKRGVCAIYHVHNNGEYANIVLRCWAPDANAGSKYYGGELMIHSSFGAWGNTWSACAQPFKEFLCNARFSGLFTKLMGTDLDVFDGQASFAAVLDSVLKERRGRDCGKEQAREVWTALMDERPRAESSDHEFGAVMSEMRDMAKDLGDMSGLFEEGWDLVKTKHDSQAVSFWNEIWPAFRNVILAEAQLEKEAAAQHEGQIRFNLLTSAADPVTERPRQG